MLKDIINVHNGTLNWTCEENNIFCVREHVVFGCLKRVTTQKFQHDINLSICVWQPQSENMSVSESFSSAGFCDITDLDQKKKPANFPNLQLY